MTFDKEINKRFGDRAVISLGSDSSLDIGCIPTGITRFDSITGIGGIPLGRITELYGSESAGKSTMCLHTVAAAQAMGLTCLYIDTENSLQPNYAEALGVNVDDLWLSQPDDGETAFEIGRAAMESGEVGLIVFDSVAAMVPRAEKAGEIGDSVPGDTPVLVRKNGLIDFIPIEDLYCGTNPLPDNRNYMWYKHFKGGKERKGIQVMTHEGWADIEGVVLKRNPENKPFLITHTSSGLAKTTPDHCLFVDGEEKSPDELNVGDLIDVADLDSCGDLETLTKDQAWLLGYWVAEGSTHGRMLTMCDTNLDTIERVSEMMHRAFGLDCLVKTRTYPEGNPRVPLHIVSCTTREEVFSLFSLCLTKEKYKKVPDVVLNASDVIKRAFIEGFNEGDGSSTYEYGYQLSTSSFTLAAGLHYLLKELGENLYVSFSDRGGSRQTEYIVATHAGNSRYAPNEIKRIREMKSGPPEFMYDMGTSAGTFVGGIGGVIYHNSHVGLQARMMSQGLRIISRPAAKSETAVMFVNQLRSKIGGYGNPDTTPGGRGLPYYASLRINMTRISEKVESSGEQIGNVVRVRIPKNKVGKPFGMVDLSIEYGIGFSFLIDLYDSAIERGALVTKGAWVADPVTGETIRQGRAKMLTLLSEDQTFFDTLKVRVMTGEGDLEFMSEE